MRNVEDWLLIIGATPSCDRPELLCKRHAFRILDLNNAAFRNCVGNRTNAIVLYRARVGRQPLNVVDKLPQAEQAEAVKRLRALWQADSEQAARKLAAALIADYRQAGYGRAAACLEDDSDRCLTFYQFPEQHWSHLRTSNVVESPFAGVRLRTNAAKRFKKTKSGVCLVHQVLLRLSQNWRRLKAAHLRSRIELPQTKTKAKKGENPSSVKAVTAGCPGPIDTGIELPRRALRVSAPRLCS